MASHCAQKSSKFIALLGLALATSVAKLLPHTLLIHVGHRATAHLVRTLLWTQEEGIAFALWCSFLPKYRWFRGWKPTSEAHLLHTTVQRQGLHDLSEKKVQPLLGHSCCLAHVWKLQPKHCTEPTAISAQKGTHLRVKTKMNLPHSFLCASSKINILRLSSCFNRKRRKKQKEVE